MASTSAEEEDNILKQFYQSSVFSLVDDNVSIRQKTDKLRSLLFFLEKLLSCKKISTASYEILYKEYSEQYHRLIDSSKGLDNYSNMISVMTEGKRNESQEWVSQLSLDKDRMPTYVKNLLCHKKKDTVKMKISISKKGNNFKENSAPSVSGINKPSVKKAETIERRAESHPPQISFHEQSNSDGRDTVVPRFGKRKQNNPNDSNGMEKKKVNTIVYGQNNVSTAKPSFGGRKKAIIYGRGGSNNSNVDEDQETDTRNPFLTAGQQLVVDMKKSGKPCPPTNSLNYGVTKKSLGAKRGISSKFIPPIGQEKGEKKQAFGEQSESHLDSKYEGYEWMKNIDPKMIELIENEIMDHGPQVSWDDIAGLDFAKTTIQEIVIWPMLRPDLFTGLRGPPKGLLLFGPPGTGKTLIGKCIASQSNAQFFNISASSLTSKWVGEGEKMVRALFGVARCQQPAVIFIDEIDSLLTQRSESEHESSRRIKTEFLVQLDGATALSEDRLLVVGATNRPQELDEAARRRLVKRLYIPLPDADARNHIIKKLMSTQLHDLNDEDMSNIVSKSSGFSGADMATLCRDAALGPIRGVIDIRNVNVNEVRPIHVADFLSALNHVRPSVSQNDLQVYVDWNATYGSGGSF